MKLSTYKNLYSYMISVSSSKGNEVVLTNFTKKGYYTVVKLENWKVVAEDSFEDVFKAKKFFRELAK